MTSIALSGFPDFCSEDEGAAATSGREDGEEGEVATIAL